MMKLRVTSIRVDQRTHFFREGSILGGTARSGAVGVDVTIEIASDDAPERIAQVVRMGKASCYTHGAVAEPVAVATHVLINGREGTVE
jgi:hypothetical protein